MESYFEHIGLSVSLKLSRNLCSFRWLKFNLKQVSKFKPVILWTAKMEFSLGLTKLRILNLNVFLESMFLGSSLRFPDSLAQQGQNDDSKTLVPPLKLFIDFWVAYRVEYGISLSYGEINPSWKEIDRLFLLNQLFYYTW